MVWWNGQDGNPTSHKQRANEVVGLRQENENIRNKLAGGVPPSRGRHPYGLKRMAKTLRNKVAGGAPVILTHKAVKTYSGRFIPETKRWVCLLTRSSSFPAQETESFVGENVKHTMQDCVHKGINLPTETRCLSDQRSETVLPIGSGWA